jgi:hypothetical protein
MQKVNMLVIVHQLKMKVVKLTQTRVTPFQNGILNTTWYHWFRN